MTTQENERFEIVKSVCGLQDYTLQEIYNFIKTGKPYVSQRLDTTPADGVYLVMRDGVCHRFTGEDIALDNENPVTGIGVKLGRRALIVSLRDAANGKDLPLTISNDETAYDGYIETAIDVVADWKGKANTNHLREIGLYPDIELNDDEYIPSVGEMYLIFTHLRELNAALRYAGGMAISPLFYWTSTESGPVHARLLNLRSGGLGWGKKTSARTRLRAVRPFYVSNINR